LPVGVGLGLAVGSTLWLGVGVTTGGVGVLTGGVGVLTGGVGVLTGGVGVLKKQPFAAVHGGVGGVGVGVGVGVDVGWLTTTVSVSPPQAATALLYVSPGKLALQ
jgi:hypothetical protein